MADEVKKYLDYEGLKHLVEKLTDRIEAVGSGTAQGTALEVRWMYKGISPTLRSGDNSGLANAILEDDDIVPRVLFCISGSDVDVWVNGVEHRSLFGGADTGADAQIPGIEEGVNVIRIVPQSDDARIWCNPARGDWDEDGELPAKLAVTAVTDWGRWRFSDVRCMFSISDDFTSSVHGLLRQLAGPVRDVFSEVTDFTWCFGLCTGLTEIPEGLFANCTAVTSFYECFDSCSGLTSLPEGLFANCPNVTTFQYCFYDCSGLTALPTGLFGDCPSATNFQSCFYGCTGLTEIPTGLFGDCPSVTTFASCFYGCTGLTGAIPAGLFDNCPSVTNFQSCFSGCSGLTGIPENLFINCTKVTNFSYCFQGVSGSPNLEGESAFDRVDIDGVETIIHLYERSNYPDRYTAPTSITYCYRYQTKLDDYDDIPSGWK